MVCYCTKKNSANGWKFFRFAPCHGIIPVMSWRFFSRNAISLVVSARAFLSSSACATHAHTHQLQSQHNTIKVGRKQTKLTDLPRRYVSFYTPSHFLALHKLQKRSTRFHLQAKLCFWTNEGFKFLCLLELHLAWILHNGHRIARSSTTTHGRYEVWKSNTFTSYWSLETVLHQLQAPESYHTKANWSW